MAAIFTIAGGTAGLAAAMAALLFLDVGLLTALAIWSGVGITSLALGLLCVLTPCRTRVDEPSAQTAT